MFDTTKPFAPYTYSIYKHSFFMDLWRSFCIFFLSSITTFLSDNCGWVREIEKNCLGYLYRVFGRHDVALLGVQIFWYVVVTYAFNTRGCLLIYSSKVFEDHLLANCMIYGSRLRRISSVILPAWNPCSKKCLCGKILFNFCRNYHLFTREPSLWENKYCKSSLRLRVNLALM